MRRSALLVGCVLLAVPSARAVIIAGNDGTLDTAAPGNGAPWDHVGSIGGTTGVYLGDYGGGYWVITADHVGLGSITLNNVTYTAVVGSGVQIGGADLFVFRISSDPGLTNLALSATAPAINSSVTMIGNGLNRATTQLYWSVSTNGNPTGDPNGTAWTWNSLPDATGANASGYAWGSGNTIRWGTNTIDSTATYNIGTGNTSALVTTFSAITGEAQGASGDSGGAMFYLNGSTWELAGILGAIANFNSQPGSTAVFNDATYAADISVYRTEIISAIPEPATTTAWIGAIAAGVVVALRRRRA